MRYLSCLNLTKSLWLVLCLGPILISSQALAAYGTIDSALPVCLEVQSTVVTPNSVTPSVGMRIAKRGRLFKASSDASERCKSLTEIIGWYTIMDTVQYVNGSSVTINQDVAYCFPYNGPLDIAIAGNATPIQQGQDKCFAASGSVSANGSPETAHLYYSGQQVKSSSDFWKGTLGKTYRVILGGNGTVDPELFGSISTDSDPPGTCDPAVSFSLIGAQGTVETLPASVVSPTDDKLRKILFTNVECQED